MSGRRHHILLVIPSLLSGGAERVISEMANWWATRGERITVLTFAGTDQDHYHLDPNVERISLNLWGRARFPWSAVDKRIRRLLMLRNSILKAHPDVVISFIDQTNIRTLTSLTGAKLPLIISERIDPRHYDIGPFLSLSRRLTYPRASALVVQTESVARWAETIMPPSRIEVIPNFVRVMPRARASGEGVKPEQPFILAMGRLDRQKGHDLLIRAFAEARTGGEEWKLVILGDGPERANLESLASRLGIGGAVSMPGIVGEPATLLRAAGFFVHPSRYEGFPNALLEAMACGCAVIASNCPSGPAEIVRNGENGLLVPMEDIDALREAMSSLMRDEKLRRRLGERAVQVVQDFSQGSIMKLWDSLITKVINRS